jgi:hypothetical protein
MGPSDSRASAVKGTADLQHRETPALEASRSVLTGLGSIDPAVTVLT